MADYQGFARNVLGSMQAPNDGFRDNALIAFKLRQDAADRQLDERKLGILEKREDRQTQAAERTASLADMELGLKLNNIALQRATAAQDEPTWRAIVQQTAQEFEAVRPGLGATILPYADRFSDRDTLIEGLVDVGKRYELMMGMAKQEDQQAFLAGEGEKDRATRLQAAAAGRTQIFNNVGPTGIDYGDPEKGLTWKRNPDGSVALDERGAPIALPYQGGSVFREQQAAEQKAAGRDEQEALKGTVVLTEIRRAREKIENAPWYDPATGMLGNILKNVAGRTAADVNALLDTVRANIGFDRLQAMREASPTGGALGNVTERELGQLQAVMGSLSQVQSEEQLLDNIDRLDKIYSAVMRKAAAYPNAAQFGFDVPPEEGGRPPAPASPPAAADLEKLSDEELLQQLGITN